MKNQKKKSFPRRVFLCLLAVLLAVYAPLLHDLAEDGILCVLVKMPCNLAVLDMNAADSIPERFSEVTDWYIGGHSLGGAMAASYAAKHTDELDGLVLLAAYSTADLTDSGSNLATVNISLEDFYAGARDADVLLYNSTIEGELRTMDELLAKCPMLADFKAVQSGNVWCTSQSLFQQSMELPELILDMNRVFTEDDPDDSELTFLTKLH